MKKLDVRFTRSPGGEHSMTRTGRGRNPSRSHMLKLADQAGVSSRQAAAIIDKVQIAVAHWPHHATTAGVTKAATEQVVQSLPRID
jgi:serine/threonine-protein kinase HipA